MQPHSELGKLWLQRFVKRCSMGNAELNASRSSTKEPSVIWHAHSVEEQRAYWEHERTGLRSPELNDLLASYNGHVLLSSQVTAYGGGPSSRGTVELIISGRGSDRCRFGSLRFSFPRHGCHLRSTYKGTLVSILLTAIQPSIVVRL